MVVVMAAEAGETEVDGVVDRVRAAGGDAFVSRGMSRTMAPTSRAAHRTHSRGSARPG